MKREVIHQIRTFLVAKDPKILRIPKNVRICRPNNRIDFLSGKYKYNVQRIGKKGFLSN